MLRTSALQLRIATRSSSSKSSAAGSRKLDLTFTDTQEAFKSKSNAELLRALVVLRLCTVEPLVKNNEKLLTIARKTLGKSIFSSLLRSSFYGHFAAGETREEVAPTVEKLQRFGVKSILDYSVESDISHEKAEDVEVEPMGDNAVPSAIASSGVLDKDSVDKVHDRYTAHREFGDRRVGLVSARTYIYAGERQCDENRDIFLKSIDSVAESTRSTGWAAIKLTALGRPQLLLKLSECIVQTQNLFTRITGFNDCTWENLIMGKIKTDELKHRMRSFGVKANDKKMEEWFKHIDFDEEGFVDFFAWDGLLDDHKRLGKMFQVLNIQTCEMEPLINNLSASEEQEFANMMDRLMEVAEYAVNKGVRVMIDAEQTYFQPAISRLTLALMRRFNKDRVNIINTYQAYLKSALTNIEMDMHLAKRENFCFGAKLVRGAYMEQERIRAKAISYEDPINPNLEATAEMYDRCLERIVDERLARGSENVSVMVATHNEEAIRKAVELMRNKGISPDEKGISFAQLYGMCDQVSFSLGQAGYSVYKYLPYGPVEEVLPYLSRRAVENGGMLQKVDKERGLLWTELTRRIRSGQFRYVVPSGI